jgi:hypothetical protein
VQEEVETDDSGIVQTAAAEALGLMLARVTDPLERVKLLLNLETQIEMVLTEAPPSGRSVESIAMRAEFAATLRAEVAKAMWSNVQETQTKDGAC